MSTRAGKFVTLEQLCSEVGVDVARYFFVMRKADSHLVFDLDLARKQSNENPVYYCQYVHARICNLRPTAEEAGVWNGDRVKWASYEPGHCWVSRKKSIWPCTSTSSPPLSKGWPVLWPHTF